MNYFAIIGEYLIVVLLVLILLRLGNLETLLQRLIAHTTMIRQLVHEGRARQSQIARRQGPKLEKAKQEGPRHDVPPTGRMASGLKFNRVGGDHERDDD